VVEPLQICEGEEAAQDADLSYAVELWDAQGERLEAVLGRLRTASLGFSCYYGALREYVDCRVVLRQGDHVVAAFNPPPRGPAR
jgi:hypothetical protein